jgi:hypothetical protein
MLCVVFSGLRRRRIEIFLLFCFQANWLHANGGAEILAAIKGAAEAPQRVEVNVTVTADK